MIVFLAIGVAVSRRDRRWLFFLGLSLFMLSIALGGNTPLYRLYYEVLPGTKQFRAPSLSFFVVAMAMVTMAALALERVLTLGEARPSGRGEPEPSALRYVPAIAGGVAGLALLGMLMSAGVPTTPGEPGIAAGWGRLALFSGALAGALHFWSRQRLGTAGLAVLLALITVVDLWSVGRRFFHTVDPPAVTFAPDDVMLFLQRQEQPVRMWTFPAPEHYRGAGSYGGNYPMLFGVEQVGGEHPNQLHRWNEYVGAGTQTYIDWHNLITDAAVVMTPGGYQAITFEARPGFLEAAAVRYIVSMAPLEHPDLQLVHQGSGLVYENTAALPRAYLVEETRAMAADAMLAAMQSDGWDPRRIAFVPAEAELPIASGPLTGETTVVQHTPDRVVVRVSANRPAFLVLADNFYEGWRATVNGSEMPIIRTNHTFRGVQVGAGDSEVVFEFRPASFFTGLYVTIAAFVLLLGLLGFLLIRGRRASTDAAPG